jgi:hypothetical protein
MVQLSQLDYRAMPCTVAHDGVLSKFSNRTAPDQGKWCGPSGQAAWTVLHVPKRSLLSAGSLSSSQQGEPSCWASLLVFGLIKGTVSRDFRLLVFFMNHIPPSPGVYH